MRPFGDIRVGESLTWEQKKSQLATLFVLHSYFFFLLGAFSSLFLVLFAHWDTRG